VGGSKKQFLEIKQRFFVFHTMRLGVVGSEQNVRQQN
jgi:hypothetical protein